MGSVDEVTDPPEHEGPGMFYEIRHYQAQSGRRDEWVGYMESVVIPFQQSHGVDVIGSFLNDEDPDGYVWIRRFASEEQRVEQYAAIYDSARWKDEIGPAAQALIHVEKIVVDRVVPTAASALA